MSQYEVLGEGRTGAAVPGSTDNSPLLPTAITSTQEHHHVQAWYGTPRGKMLLLFGGFFLVIVALALAIGLTLGAGVSDPTLASAASTSAIMNTLNQFESFALSNGGSRSVGSAGYELSATYIETQLSATKAWNHTRQPFFGPVYTQYANPTLSLTAPFQVNFQLATDFSGMRYGGNGSYAITGGAVFRVAAQGCNAADYLGIDNVLLGGSPVIALVSSASPCTAYDKALMAQAFNASAILIYSTVLSNARVRAVDWTPQSPTVAIPTLSVTNSVFQVLLAAGTQAQLNLSVNNSFLVYETFNIIATYVGKSGHPPGSPTSIVAIGSHLDSVPAGPGINDDGSGSAINLELAVKFPTLKLNPQNLYQAMWWGSEEEGLIGSRFFVRQLNASGLLPNYALYINMDMLASPNYILKILAGNTTADTSIRAPSMVITNLFEQAFQSQRVPYQLSAMSGGSDFLPFIEAGIPSSGLLAGASEIKTSAERAIFGGLANAPLDPCYHQPCDTVLNINQECLAYNTAAAATVLEELVMKHDLPSFLVPPPTTSTTTTTSAKSDSSSLRWG